MKKIKVKAGALQYVLVISVIIAIVIFAFISLIFLQQKLKSKYNFSKEAVHATQMGFDYLKKNKIAYTEKTEINFSEKAFQKTTILKKHWGIFDIGIIETRIKNESFKKIGILGTETKERDALYLQENNNSLVLVGNTKIIGNVSLPKQGVKSGNIAGTSYQGSQLIYGNTKSSKTSLPEIKNIDFLQRFYTTYEHAAMKPFELSVAQKMQQSFEEETLLFESNSKIILENSSLSGNILIVSATEIQVSSSAILEDVILIAPRITIKKNTKGNFQAIADTEIKVAENCSLNYPTALILLEKKIKTGATNAQTMEKVQIEIAKNSHVKGIVLYYAKETLRNYLPQLIIEEKAIVTGEVYCIKNIELKGSVFGTVYANSFIAKQFGGVYVNHIYNGIINAKKLPRQFSGLQIEKESNTVAKWVQ
jgi:hypothetical protein